MKISSVARQPTIAASVILASIAILVLTGWTFDIPAIKGIAPGLGSMKPISAVMFLLSSLVLWKSARSDGASQDRIGLLAATVVTIWSSLTILEYAIGIDFHIDRLLFPDHLDMPGTIPGRMSIVAAFNFVLFGTARLAASHPSRRVQGWFVNASVLGFLISFLALIGYAYGAPIFYKPHPATSIALNTAIAFVILFVGLTTSRPDLGWVARVRSSEAGGTFIRTILAAVLLGVPTLGWLRLQGEVIGLYDTRTGIAIFTTASIALLITVIWVAAGYVSRLDGRRLNVKIRHQSALAEFGSEALKVDTESDLNKLAVDRIRGGLDAAFAGVVEVDEESGRATSFYTVGDKYYPAEIALDVLPKSSPLHHAMRTRELVLIPDLSQEKLLMFSDEHMEKLKSGLMVTPAAPGPVKRVLIALFNEPRSFHNDEKEFLAAIGTAFTIACERVAIAQTLREMNADLREAVSAKTELLATTAESKRLLDALFQNADSPIFDKNLSKVLRYVRQVASQGVTDFRGHIMADELRLNDLASLVVFNEMNRAAHRLLEIGDGETWSSKNHFAHRQNALMALDIAEAMFLGETSLRSETEVVSSRGKSVSILHCLPIPTNETDAQRVPCVAMDLTEFKMAQSAREASTAKSQFLASMSHEIRTPLNGIIGNLELLSLTEISAEQVELVDQAEKASKALLALIGNILDFSKIEQGKLAIEMSDVNPSKIVEDAVAMLQSKARLKGLFVSTEFGPDVPQLVRSDAVRLRQIILNLVGNAIKFTETGSIAVRVAANEQDGNLCVLKFAVHDSGRGFDQSRAEQLFEAFIQDNVALDTSEGTGLGLSICRKLVEALGGDVDCEGVPGEGASFWFTLPVQVLSRGPGVRKAVLSDTKVAIVGSKTPFLAPLKNYFLARSASVLEADDLGDALAALQPTASETSTSQVALLLHPSTDTAAEIVRDLRKAGIVPIMYGTDGSSHSLRVALRLGFATVIPTQDGPALLDLNIAALLGHVPHPERVPQVTQGAPTLSFENRRVLVLEDKLVNQLVIQKQLARLKIQFTMAGDGLKGLAALERETFDLILCDCSMPNMNGYDFTRTVREHEKADGAMRHIPIVALTANAFREDVEKCLSSGMDDFVSKPVSLERLSEALNKWLNSAQTLHSPVMNIELTAEEPAIDVSALESVLGASEPEILNEILGEFPSAARQSFATLKSALSSNGVNRVQAAAHGAKGEARSAGATRLGQCYAEIERQAKAGDMLGLDQVAARIGDEIRRVEEFIARRLTGAFS